MLLARRGDEWYLEVVSLRPAGPRSFVEARERRSLGFIRRNGRPLFPASRSARSNADLFVEEMDARSIAECTPLFSEAACAFLAGGRAPSAS